MGVLIGIINGDMVQSYGSSVESWWRVWYSGEVLNFLAVCVIVSVVVGVMWRGGLKGIWLPGIILGFPVGALIAFAPTAILLAL